MRRFLRKPNKRPVWAEEWLPGKPLNKEHSPFRETLVFGSPESETPSHVRKVDPLKEPSGNFYDWAKEAPELSKGHDNNVDTPDKSDTTDEKFKELADRIGELATEVRKSDLKPGDPRLPGCLQEIPEELL